MMKKPKLIKDKRFLTVLSFIENSLGPVDAGILISILADSLNNLVKDAPERNIRTISIKYNDYFETIFDCDKGEYIDGNQ